MHRTSVTTVALFAGLLACIAIASAAPQEKTCESGQDKVLLVFNAGASTITAPPNDRSNVSITIADTDRQSVVFGDRPSRLVAAIDTQTVIDFLADVATNDPANLAIVGHLPDGNVEILIIETLDANVEPNGGYVFLKGRLLEGFDAPDLISNISNGMTFSQLDENRSYESIDVFVDDVASCCPGDIGCDIQVCGD